tara:strand:- start:172 stop:276 length:105 start_codon:yes stop_codon:yes gene_type:complete
MTPDQEHNWNAIIMALLKAVGTFTLIAIAVAIAG